MNRSLVSLVAATSLLAAGAPTRARACTGISLTAQDGTVVRARTLEFGFPVQSRVLVIPAGQPMRATLPGGGKGMAFETRYSVVGASVLGYHGYLDGVNDQGLSAGLFYFPGFAGYAAAQPDDAAKALAPQDFVAWILGTFATIDEVRAGIDDVVLVPTPLPGLGSRTGMVAPVHFFVEDRSGKSIVIEPIDGTLRVHDAPLGVVTNAPPYDWHMTHLRNYLNLTVGDIEQVRLGDVTLAALSSGTGLTGLPGDFTSPSRLVRAAIFSANAEPTATATDAVLQAFHILNQFDIPPGSVQISAVGGKPVPEHTEWTSAADLTNRRWYFRTFEDQSIRVVDLETAVAAAAGKIATISMESKQPIADVSTALVRD